MDFHKTKYDENGEEIKSKAWLIVKGFTAKYETGYDGMQLFILPSNIQSLELFLYG